MKRTEFEYHLPEELIAQHPLKQRDHARLLVVDRKRQKITHDVFYNVGAYLPKESCLVLNDSKVIPSRLLGVREKTGGRVEVFLLKQIDDYLYEAMLKPLKKIKEGETLVFEGGRLKIQLVDREKRIVRIHKKNIEKELQDMGHMPLPPYIKRPDQKSDKQDYQTVYAKKSGSVAAPTAGLHFTDDLLLKLRDQRHSLEKVTLHVNYGTFKPVEEDNILDHHMHTESFSLTKKTFQSLHNVKKKKRSVVAIGTTSCRVLESVGKDFLNVKNIEAVKRDTNIFIYPGYEFQMVDALITNFHLPASTLLMLVHAFGSPDLMKRAYQEAIENKYRFYSYGDAMLIL